MIKYSCYDTDGKIKPYSRRYRPDGYYQKRYERSKELWGYQQVRLSCEDHDLLRRYAKAKNLPVSELIRTYITWGLENEDTRTQEIALKFKNINPKELRKLYQDRQEEILKEWKAGEKAVVIAKRHKVHESYPGQLAKKRGLPSRQPWNNKNKSFRAIDLGAKLRKKRKKLGVDQRAFAKQVGVGQPTLSQWEIYGVPAHGVKKIEKVLRTA